MKRWIVCYADKDGDISKVWTFAETEEDAIEDVKHEYWNIKEVIYCYEM